MKHSYFPDAGVGIPSTSPLLIMAPSSIGTFLAILALILSLQNSITTLKVPEQYPSISAALIEAGNLNRAEKPVEILVSAGTYREAIGWNPSTAAGLTLRAAERGSVVVSGSNEVVWTRIGTTDVYTIPWTYNWGPSGVPANWPDVPQIARQREMIFVTILGELAPRRFVQTLNCAAIALNQFCVNETTDLITFRTADTPIKVEAAVRATLFAVTNASNVVIDGLIFQHSVADLQNNAVVLTKVTSSRIVNSSFVQNNGTGLGVTFSADVRTENNLFNDNGYIGYATSRSDRMTSVNDTANRNNWRGAQGAFTDWSNGGFKWLFQRDSYIFGLIAASNLSHGLWLDFDNQNILVENLASVDNLEYGVFLEASTGPITIRNSLISGNSRCVFIGNTTNILLQDVECRTSRNVGILIGGDMRRAVKDRVTGVTYQVPPSQYLTLQNVNVSGTSAAFRHGTWDWPTLQSTLRVIGGSYTRTSGSPIEINSTSMTTAQWLSSLPALPEPSPMPPVVATITATFSPEPTFTATFTLEASPSVTPSLAPTVKPPPVPTEEGLEIIIDVVVTGVLRIKP